jgi:hypothetical protein
VQQHQEALLLLLLPAAAGVGGWRLAAAGRRLQLPVRRRRPQEQREEEGDSAHRAGTWQYAPSSSDKRAELPSRVVFFNFMVAQKAQSRVSARLVPVPR